MQHTPPDPTHLPQHALPIGHHHPDTLRPAGVDAAPAPGQQLGVEQRQVDLGAAVGVGVVFFEVELGFVVEQSVEEKGCAPVSALDGSAVEGGVVVGDEGVELQGEMAESGAVGLLEHVCRQGEAQTVAGLLGAPTILLRKYALRSPATGSDSG